MVVCVHEILTLKLFDLKQIPYLNAKNSSFYRALAEAADELGDNLKFQDELKVVNQILKSTRDRLEEPPL